LNIDGLSGTAALHAVPIGQGTYHISQTFFEPVNPISGVTVSSADFTFILNVVSGTVTTLPPEYNPNAPEASTWLLTALGLAALLWRRGFGLRDSTASEPASASAGGIAFQADKSDYRELLGA
jgi:hypothetical protein